MPKLSGKEVSGADWIWILGFSQCFLLGCIILPTDPIAAMSILKTNRLASSFIKYLVL